MNTQQSPFFSVIIPTRNRGKYISETVASVTKQEFHDMEIIVSDNSTNDRTYQQLVADGLVDAVRYVKPPREMPMPEHWEFATRLAKGKYVLVLTDRSVLKNGALEIIRRSISNQKASVDVCSWGWSVYDDELGIEFSRYSDNHPNDRTLLLDAATLANRFADPRNPHPYALPRGLNSCYSAVVADNIRNIYGTLFKPINPDFTSAFLLLASVESVLHIDSALFVSRGLAESNGGNAYIRDASGYLSTLGLENWRNHAPIQSPLVENIIFEDFLAMRELAGAALGRCQIDWVSYLLNCYKELLVKKGHGVIDEQYIQSLFHDWKSVVGTFNWQIRLRVWYGVLRLFPIRLKYSLRNTSYGPRLVKLYRRSRAMYENRSLAVAARDVLEIAGFRSEKR